MAGEAELEVLCLPTYWPEAAGVTAKPSRKVTAEEAPAMPGVWMPDGVLPLAAPPLECG
jgi:hypothetical protein